MIRHLCLLLLLLGGASRADDVPPEWGDNIDPQGLARWTAEGKRLSLAMTPKAGTHPDFNVGHGFDAPHRALEVSGDFTVEVTASPVTLVLPADGALPGGWIGNGLLVEVAPGTYARLIYGFVPDRAMGTATVVWDLVRDGRVIAVSYPHEVAANPESLLCFRIERRAGRLYGAAGQDAAEMTPLYPLDVRDWPAAVKVGVIAFDITDQPVEMNFDDFRVTPHPGAAPVPRPRAPAPPPPPPKPLKGPEVAGWGRFDDPEGTGNWSLNGPGLELELSGAGIDLSRLVHILNAPRVLREVIGDFTATVQVETTMSPANPWRAGQGLWQTAGLMLTIDGTQYVRYEISVHEDWGRTHRLHLEGGQPEREIGLSHFARDPAEPTSLRIQRRGEVATVSARQGAHDWETLGETTLTGWPAALRVGVEATNTTGNPFTAKFRDFAVTTP